MKRETVKTAAWILFFAVLLVAGFVWMCDSWSKIRVVHRDQLVATGKIVDATGDDSPTWYVDFADYQGTIWTAKFDTWEWSTEDIGRTKKVFYSQSNPNHAYVDGRAYDTSVFALVLFGLVGLAWHGVPVYNRWRTGPKPQFTKRKRANKHRPSKRRRDE